MRLKPSGRVGVGMDLSRATWRAVADDVPSVGLLPVGSVEQHGPHAPLGTDLLIAEAVARRGADRCDEHVVVTPSVPVGIAAEHRRFAGTLWVTPDTFRAYVREIAAGLASHGVGAVVLVNGHGGNTAALEEVAHALTRSATCQTAAFTWFDSLEGPPEPMGHGGALETAALLAIDPSLVDEGQLEAAATAASDRWGAWVGGTNLAVDTDEFAPNGVVGDPTAATAELGETVLAEAAEHLAEVASTLADRVGQSD